MKEKMHATTVLCVRQDGKLVMGADGQVTFQNTVLKHKTKKIRRLYNDRILAGFAGATSDAFALFQRFETKLEEYNGNISRAAVELSKDWRTDKVLRRLEAMLIVANEEKMYILSGTGDIIEPDENVLAIGSGGPYAQAVALALSRETKLGARAIVEKSMDLAADICIFTNKNFTIEEL